MNLLKHLVPALFSICFIISCQNNTESNVNKISMQMDTLNTSINAIKGLTLDESSGIRSIRFSDGITNESLAQLLYVLKTNSTPFAVYDELLYSSKSDPGAYLSYSQEKNDKKNCWSMTLGNHGWSGGIYHISDSIIIIQLKNLIDNKFLQEIKIDKVAFFSHYKIEAPEESQKMENRILEIHIKK